MDRMILVFLASLLAGFSLIKVSLAGTFLSSLEPFTTIIGVLAVIVFSLALIYQGVKTLFNK
ncbi:hypothetical protein [Peribacillus loiseleuriae]|uniref:Uncharacterized protein n=1 Tax=Peribacillus loiseleuriae TaxID=1679170 RepID=A0A0K9GWL6_9BACI|nr:hypothetical protein [Peribacillus loiseleuriae]KMY51006.1 hypothetical protein AC625_16930 [Peribacillus loiseleuriae]